MAINSKLSKTQVLTMIYIVLYLHHKCVSPKINMILSITVDGLYFIVNLDKLLNLVICI